MTEIEHDPRNGELNMLCAQYQTTHDREVLGKMYVLCKERFNGLVLRYKALSGHVHNKCSDLFDDAVYDKLQEIAASPNTDPERFVQLYAVSLRRSFIDVLRRTNRQRKTVNSGDYSPSGWSSFMEDHALNRVVERPDEDNAPEINRSLKYSLVEILKKSSLDRILVIVHKLQDKTDEEIAQSLHMPLGTVKTNLRLFKARLKEAGLSIDDPDMADTLVAAVKARLGRVAVADLQL